MFRAGGGDDRFHATHGWRDLGGSLLADCDGGQQPRKIGAVWVWMQVWMQ